MARYEWDRFEQPSVDLSRVESLAYIGLGVGGLELAMFRSSRVEVSVRTGAQCAAVKQTQPPRRKKSPPQRGETDAMPHIRPRRGVPSPWIDEPWSAEGEGAGGLRAAWSPTFRGRMGDGKAKSGNIFCVELLTRRHDSY